MVIKEKSFKSSIVFLLVGAFLFSGCVKNVPVIFSDSIPMERGESLEANYNKDDYYGSLEEIIDVSSIVISGTVEKTEEYGEFSVISKLNINDTIYGDVKDSVRVIEIGELDSQTILQEDEEYILVLKKQSDDTYYILGRNIQGKFLNEEGKVVNNDEIMEHEILDLVNQENKFTEDDVSKEEHSSINTDSLKEMKVSFSDFKDYLDEKY